MKTVSLFSGCGGMELGFIWSGYNIVWANDIEHDACETYRLNIGDHIIEENISNIDFNCIPDCDVILGGFPCQDFSMIWKRGGIKTDRGNLYQYFVRAVQYKKPRLFVAENVKGLVTANKGKAIKTIIEDFKNCGYKIYADVYNFADYGTPQIRERVLIIGIRQDIPFYYQKPQPSHSPDNYITCGEALKGVEKAIYNNEYINIKPKTKKILELIPEGEIFMLVKLHIKETFLYKAIKAGLQLSNLNLQDNLGWLELRGFIRKDEFQKGYLSQELPDGTKLRSPNYIKAPIQLEQDLNKFSELLDSIKKSALES